MSHSLIFIMIICLITTIACETLVAFSMKVRDKMDFINIVLANILTNPLVVTIPFYFNIRYSVLYRNVTLLVLEILTLFVEGKIYKKYLFYKKINPYLFSLILNVSSYTIGCFINYLIYY